MDERSEIAAKVASEARVLSGPWTLEVYPTLRCNLSCAFCDTTDRHQPAQGELSTARWLGLIDEAAALGARSLMVLGGGEPLIAAATLPLMRRAKEHGLRGMLTTNGTLLGAAAQDELLEIGWDEVHLSIDGATAGTHDQLRGRTGSFSKTVRAACRLRQRQIRLGLDRPRIAIHTVLTRLNLREIPAILRLAAALGAWRVDVDALIAYRPEQLALALSPADHADLPAIIDAGVAEAARLGIQTSLANLRAARALRRGVEAPSSGAGTGLAAAPCLRPWHHLVLQADGRSAPCCVRTGEGPAPHNGIASLWRESPALASLRAELLAGRAPGRCAECSENILQHERGIRVLLPPSEAG